ncbi:MAG: DHH family phosphoesterase, partial [Candidatus Altarchaeaceae archaeon]
MDESDEIYEEKFEKLLIGVKNFSENLKKEDNFLIISHIDADGIASCAIIIDLLKFLNKKFSFVNIKQLYEETIKEISLEEKINSIIFTDMGSGQIDIINKISEFQNKKIFIIDHHQPKLEHLTEKINNIYHLNPFIYGIDGSFEISASGMCYLVAKSLGRIDMVDIAIVGAVGDTQDSSGKLIGANRKILEDGKNNNIIKFKKDIRLFGRESRPLVYMLAYSSDPFIPDLTGNVDACKEFLHSIGIKILNENSDNGKWISYVDLSFEDRKKLVSALYEKILIYDEISANSLIGEVY